jgi:hypothetical protein
MQLALPPNEGNQNSKNVLSNQRKPIPIKNGKRVAAVL